MSSSTASSASNTSTKATSAPVESGSRIETLVYAPGTCSFGSMIALEWSGLSYHLVRHEFLNESYHENFHKISPVMQQTPQLVHSDGSTLAESSAILQHIARNAPSKRLWISGPEDKVDEFNFVLAFLHTSFYSSWVPAWQAFRYYKPDSEASSALREIATRQVLKAVAQMEKLLEGKEWIVGGRKTIADAYFAGIIRWNFPLKIVEDLPAKFPCVFKHFLKLEADAAVQFAHAIEDKKDATTTGKFLGSLSFQDLVL